MAGEAGFVGEPVRVADLPPRVDLLSRVAVVHGVAGETGDPVRLAPLAEAGGAQEALVFVRREARRAVTPEAGGEEAVAGPRDQRRVAVDGAEKFGEVPAGVVGIPLDHQLPQPGLRLGEPLPVAV